MVGVHGGVPSASCGAALGCGTDPAPDLSAGRPAGASERGQWRRSKHGGISSRTRPTKPPGNYGR